MVLNFCLQILNLIHVTTNALRLFLILLLDDLTAHNLATTLINRLFAHYLQAWREMNAMMLLRSHYFRYFLIRLQEHHRFLSQHS